MKKIIVVLGLALLLLPSCKKEDVFALWRDPSLLVREGESTTFFTMMHYNIWGANNWAKSEASGKWQDRADKLAAVINVQKADFCTLIEVDSMTTRNKFHMAKEIANRTGMYYAYAKAMNAKGGWYGDAVLSKYPIKEIRRFHLKPDPAQGSTQAEDRAICAIRVEVNGTSLWVVSAHLDHRMADTGADYELSRIKQAREMEGIVASLEGSVVLGGDLNARPTDETMNIIFGYMTPQYPSATKEYYTWPAEGIGYGSTYTEPVKLVDYILLKNNERRLERVSFRVVNSAASDHCAIVATFKINE